MTQKIEIELSDDQLQLLLETLAEKHIILYWQNKDKSEIEKLIQDFVITLEKNNKSQIVKSVFEEIKK